MGNILSMLKDMSDRFELTDQFDSLHLRHLLPTYAGNGYQNEGPHSHELSPVEAVITALSNAALPSNSTVNGEQLYAPNVIMYEQLYVLLVSRRVGCAVLSLSGSCPASWAVWSKEPTPPLRPPLWALQTRVTIVFIHTVHPGFDNHSSDCFHT